MKYLLITILLLSNSFLSAQNSNRDSSKVRGIQTLPLVPSHTTNVVKKQSNDSTVKSQENTVSVTVTNQQPKRWTYSIHRIYDSVDDFEDLNNKGADGWELVSAVYYSEYKYLLCIYKKPIY